MRIRDVLSIIFGKNGLIALTALFLASAGIIIKFPKEVCSFYYSDNIFLLKTPISLCRGQLQWQPYLEESKVKALVQNGRLRNFGEQCYDNNHCTGGSDGIGRCLPLDQNIPGSPKFCTAKEKHCPFPGSSGLKSSALNSDPNISGYSETTFGSTLYYCEQETDGTTTKRYFVTKR